MKLTGKDSVLSEYGEDVIPWQLKPPSLNKDEDSELARRRQMAPTITSKPSFSLRATVPAKERQSMGVISTVATKASSALSKYSPAVIEEAKKQLGLATGGKADVANLTAYVGESPARLKVATESLLRSGVMLGDVLPRDLVGTNAQLKEVRASAETLVGMLRAAVGARGDHTLSQDASLANKIATDALMKKRVKAALEISGTAERYFLAFPNGGIPMGEFTWYQQIVKGA